MSELVYHGGPTIRGDRLLPPDVTGVCRSDPDAPDGWVYVTPVRSLAEVYGATCRGWVYEVAPVGELEQDPGSALPPGESLRCREARIIRRWRLSASQCATALAVLARASQIIEREGTPT